MVGEVHEKARRMGHEGEVLIPSFNSLMKEKPQKKGTAHETWPSLDTASSGTLNFSSQPVRILAGRNHVAKKAENTENQSELTLGEPRMNNRTYYGIENLSRGPHSEGQCNSRLETIVLASKTTTFLPSELQ